MNELRIHGTLDSREVAAMVGKSHGNLVRDIDTYISYMQVGGEIKIDSSNFFIESTYQSEQNKTVKCYLITKKGCEMIANKLTGAKGIQFTATYVTRFNEMEQGAPRQLPPAPSDPAALLRAQAMYKNAQTRQFKAIMATIADKTKLAPIAVEVFGLKALEQITGINVGDHLPACERMLSATEVGKKYGISSAMVGRLANQHGVKTPENGIYVMDKSPHSAKEVQAFRYNSRGVARIGQLLMNQ